MTEEPGSLRDDADPLADGVTQYAFPTLVPEAATGAVPRSIPLGVAAYVAAGTEVVSPAAALVRSVVSGELVLALVDGGWLHVDGVNAQLEAGQTVATGEALGTSTGPLWIQLCVSAVQAPALRRAGPRRQMGADLP